MYFSSQCHCVFSHTNTKAWRIKSGNIFHVSAWRWLITQALFMSLGSSPGVQSCPPLWFDLHARYRPAWKAWVHWERLQMGFLHLFSKQMKAPSVFVFLGNIRTTCILLHESMQAGEKHQQNKIAFFLVWKPPQTSTYHPRERVHLHAMLCLPKP